MQLIIVESPTKAKAIKQYLGDSYEVLASKGHIRNIQKKPFGVDVENHFEVSYEMEEKAADIVAELKKKCEEADKVYIATDPDREGEAIAWHLCEVLGIDPATDCRIEYQEVTKSAVQNALQNPRCVDNPLKEAALTRSVLDYLVGFKVSRLLWTKVTGRLSAGRVQTPVLHLICEKEKEREAFVPEESWTIEADLGGMHVVCKEETKNQTDAEKIKGEVEKADFTVKDVQTSSKKEKPKPPFTTSSLQQAAVNQLNFDAEQTMRVAQKLFEGVKLPSGEITGLITYMRTDSVRVSAEAVSEAREHIRMSFGDDFLPEKERVYGTASNAQDAHEAIRPVSLSYTPEMLESVLNEESFKLYKLIYNRFVASQMQDAQRETLSVSYDANGHEFRTSLGRIAFSGYRKAYETFEDSEEQNIDNFPKIEKGEKTKAEEVKCVYHETKPPARYTQASMVKTMEELGIGRPSTYASMIRTVKDRGYVEQDGKALTPRDLGKIVDEKLQSYFTIFNVEFTKDMEERLDAISKGKANRQDTLKEYWEVLSEELDKAYETMPKWTAQDTEEICPNCGANLKLRLATGGIFYGCSNFPVCTYTRAIPVYSSSECKECHKPKEKRHRTNGLVFYVCTNPECPECYVSPRKKAIAEKEAKEGLSVLPWARTIKMTKTPCSTMKFAKRILAASPEELKLNGQDISTWLVKKGVLEERPDKYGAKRFLPTELGTEMGIQVVDRAENQKPYEIAMLSQEVQRLVVQNLKDFTD